MVNEVNQAKESYSRKTWDLIYDVKLKNGGEGIFHQNKNRNIFKMPERLRDFFKKGSEIWINYN